MSPGPVLVRLVLEEPDELLALPVWLLFLVVGVDLVVDDEGALFVGDDLVPEDDEPEEKAFGVELDVVGLCDDILCFGDDGEEELMARNITKASAATTII